MTSLRYHRNYLWIFFYSYFILMIVALSIDIGSPISESKLKLPRFLNVVFPFIFSVFGALVQHHCSRWILDLDLLSGDYKKWNNKFIKVKGIKKDDVKKLAKKKVFMWFIASNTLSNIISILPLFIWAVLLALSQTQPQISKIFNKEFFLISFCLKHASWYLTLFSSKLTLFFRKKRVRNLI